MKKDDFISVINYDSGVCGFLAFFMSKKGYTLENAFENNVALADLLRNLEAGLGRYTREEFLEGQSALSLRKLVILECKKILLRLFNDNSAFRTEAIAFTNSLLFPATYQRRLWKQSLDLDNLGLSEENPVGVALTPDMVENILNYNKLLFLKEEPGYEIKAVLSMSIGPTMYNDCILGIGPVFEKSPADNPDYLKYIPYRGLRHWIYIDKNGNCSNYGVTRPFQKLLSETENDGLDYTKKIYEAYDIKYVYRFKVPKVEAIPVSSGLGASAPEAAENIPSFRIATGDTCLLPGDRFSIRGLDFRGDKNITVKIYTAAEALNGEKGRSIYEEEIPYKKIEGRQIRTAPIQLTNAGTFQPGSYVAKAYIDKLEEARCQFLITPCVPKGTSLTWKIIFWLVALAVVGAVTYYTIKRRIYAQLAKEALLLIAKNVRMSDGIEILQFAMPIMGLAAKKPELWNTARFPGLRTQVVDGECIIEGKADAIEAMIRSLSETPVFFVRETGDDEAEVIPSAAVDMNAFRKELEPDQPEGNLTLLNSTRYVPTKNALFGMKLLPGYFFYDPKSKRMLVLQYDRNVVLYDVTDESICKPLWTTETNAPLSGRCKNGYDIKNPPFYLEITANGVILKGGTSALENRTIDWTLTAGAKAESFAVSIEKGFTILSDNGSVLLESPASRKCYGQTTLEQLITENEIAALPLAPNVTPEPTTIPHTDIPSDHTVIPEPEVKKSEPGDVPELPQPSLPTHQQHYDDAAGIVPLEKQLLSDIEHQLMLFVFRHSYDGHNYENFCESLSQETRSTDAPRASMQCLESCATAFDRIRETYFEKIDHYFDLISERMANGFLFQKTAVMTIGRSALKAKILLLIYKKLLFLAEKIALFETRSHDFEGRKLYYNLFSYGPNQERLYTFLKRKRSEMENTLPQVIFDMETFETELKAVQRQSDPEPFRNHVRSIRQLLASYFELLGALRLERHRLTWQDYIDSRGVYYNQDIRQIINVLEGQVGNFEPGDYWKKYDAIVAGSNAEVVILEKRLQPFTTD